MKLVIGNLYKNERERWYGGVLVPPSILLYLGPSVASTPEQGRGFLFLDENGKKITWWCEGSLDENHLKNLPLLRGLKTIKT